jgi:hypothetical protein
MSRPRTRAGAASARYAGAACIANPMPRPYMARPPAPNAPPVTHISRRGPRRVRARPAPAQDTRCAHACHEPAARTPRGDAGRGSGAPRDCSDDRADAARRAAGRDSTATTQVPRGRRTEQDEQAGRRRHDHRGPTCSPGTVAVHPCARGGVAVLGAALLCCPCDRQWRGNASDWQARHLHKMCTEACSLTCHSVEAFYGEHVAGRSQPTQ